MDQQRSLDRNEWLDATDTRSVNCGGRRCAEVESGLHGRWADDMSRLVLWFYYLVVAFFVVVLAPLMLVVYLLGALILIL